jgi:hypothetical protein
MENEEAVKDTQSNQNMILKVCFTITVGGITFLVSLMYGKNLTYSLIPVGLTLISWVLSIFSGLIFLVKRGNNSAHAQSGEEVPVHKDFYNTPKYIHGQLYLCCAGIVFLLVWLAWHLLSNTISWLPK